MSYKEDCIKELKKIIDASSLNEDTASRHENACARTILSHLELNGTTGANEVSKDLLSLANHGRRFSNEYKSLLKNYDVQRMINEKLKFGEILTVVVTINNGELKNHQVQICEGTEKDFGGLDPNGNYHTFDIITEYPQGAEIYGYIKSRFLSKFSGAKVSTPYDRL